MLRRHLRGFAIAGIIVPALCLGLSLTGCSGGGSSHNDSTTSTPASVSTTVSATQGGTVTGPDGVQLVVPANALAADTQITIKKSTASAAPLTLGDGTVLPIKADSVYEFLPHGVAFSSPITVRIPVSGDTSELAAYMSEPDSGWYPVASTAGNGYLEFTRSHFSSAAVASKDMMGWTLSRFQHVNLPSNSGTILRAAYDASNTALTIPTGIEFSFAVDFTLDLSSNTFQGTACSNPQLVAKSLDGITLNWPFPATVTQSSGQLTINAAPSGTFNAALAGAHTLILEVQCPAFASKPPQLRLSVNLIPQAEWVDDKYALYSTGKFVDEFIEADRWYITEHTLDNNGALSGLGEVEAGKNPYSMTVSPSGKYVYVTNANDGTVSQFTIGATGTLSAGSSVTSGGDFPVAMAVAPSGKFAYVINRNSNSIAQYSVGNHDALAPLTPATVSTGQSPGDIAIDASGRYLYATSITDKSISRYSIGGNGTLTALGTTAVTSDARLKVVKIALAPNGKYLYAVQSPINSEDSGAASGIAQYAIGGDGGLTALSTATVQVGNFPLHIVIDPSGKFAYVQGLFGTIAQYGIDATGALSPLTPATVASGNLSTLAIIEPSGQYLYALSTLFSNELNRYAIGSTGTLTKLDSTSIPAPSSVSSRSVSSFAFAKYRSTYSVGGSAALNGDTVTLQLNGSSNLTLSSDGSFTFDASLAAGSYSVTVLTQPTNGDICTVANGSGTLAGSDITNVAVTCGPPTYPVNVVVSGLTAGDSVTLLNNGGNALTVGMNGSSNFSTALLSGAAYDVTVQAQTAGQACSVNNGSGTINAAAANVMVSCAAQSYTVGGSISGLANSNNTVTLQLSSGGNSTSTVVTGNTAFTLNPALLHGASYTVSVLQSPGNSCSVSAGGSGTIAAANIDNVAISCWALHYSIGGSISNLSSSGLVLANGTDMRSVSAGATTFTMPTSQISGASYYITVHQQPSGDTCAVTSQGTAVVGSANVTDITVVCAANQFTVGGSVSGLANSNDTVTLQLSDGTTPTNTIVTGNGSFTLNPQLPGGANYTVSVAAQPSGQTCSVTAGGSGTISSASVTNVAVSCEAAGSGPYFIAGSVSGLIPGATVVLQNNNGDDLTVTGTGEPVPFQFVTPVAGSYEVTVLSHSMDVMMCVVNGGSGTAGADVTDIGVSCF